MAREELKLASVLASESKMATLAELSKLMALYPDYGQLCRSLVHSPLLFGSAAKVKGVQLGAIGDDGSLVELGSFGERPVEIVASPITTSELADAFRGLKMTVTRQQANHSIVILTLGLSYPVAALFFKVEHSGDIETLDEYEAGLVASLGSLYLSDLQSASDSPKEKVRLSPRQLTVLAEIANGKTNQEIAEQTGTSLSNIRQTTVAIYSKLGVHTRREAAELAQSMGLVS